jgi:cell division septation protein DedD
MVLDYRERKPVGKNRPRKQPVKSLAFSFLIVAVLAYGAGMLTGRIVFGKRGAVENQPGSASQTEQQTLPANQTAAGRATTEEPPFTFYETLPKGGKAVIGSGINHSVTESATATSKPNPTLPQAQSPVVKADKPQLTALPSAKPEAAQAQGAPPAATLPAKTPQPQKTVADKGKFTIQVASCQSRKEAEEIKIRYATSGVAAYIVESNIPGKGLWYRVRLGKGLDQEKAKEMAVKFGKSAIVIPEHEL